MRDVRLHIAGYADSDLEEQAELTGQLEQELLELDVEAVSRPAARAPEHAKGNALAWAQLVVTAGGALPALITAVRSWLGRHPEASITVEIDGDRLTLTDPSAEERDELIAAWMSRHGG